MSTQHTPAQIATGDSLPAPIGYAATEGQAPGAAHPRGQVGRAVAEMVTGQHEVVETLVFETADAERGQVRSSRPEGPTPCYIVETAASNVVPTERTPVAARTGTAADPAEWLSDQLVRQASGELPLNPYAALLLHAAGFAPAPR